MESQCWEAAVMGRCVWTWTVGAALVPVAPCPS